MNFEIIVRSTKNGKFIVLSPTFPDCKGEGSSLDEAMDTLIEKIADSISGKIKKTLKNAMKEIAKKAGTPGKSGEIAFSGVLTNLPISLN